MILQSIFYIELMYIPRNYKIKILLWDLTRFLAHLLVSEIGLQWALCTITRAPLQHYRLIALLDNGDKPPTRIYPSLKRRLFAL